MDSVCVRGKWEGFEVPESAIERAGGAEPAAGVRAECRSEGRMLYWGQMAKNLACVCVCLLLYWRCGAGAVDGRPVIAQPPPAPQAPCPCSQPRPGVFRG